MRLEHLSDSRPNADQKISSISDRPNSSGKTQMESTHRSGRSLVDGISPSRVRRALSVAARIAGLVFMVRGGTLRRLARGLAVFVTCVATIISTSVFIPIARAQTPDEIGDQLLALRDSLGTIETERASVLANLDRLDAEMADMNTAITNTRLAVAAAESSIVQSSARVGRSAAALYRHPTSRLEDLSSLLGTGSVNGYIVGQKYLEAAFARDTDALEDFEAARVEQQRLTDELNDQRGALQEQQRQQREWQAIVVASIVREQQAISELEVAFKKAQRAQAFPWEIINGCNGAPTTGLDGPYTLEEWATWTLTSVASRLGRAPEDAVTQEHVVALIAFARGEGGGIQGHAGQYNPLNLNGWTRVFADLGGIKSGVGTDNWPTFDAGVEASARALTSKNYTRLGTLLVNPQSTAEDFFGALSNPFAYAGNKNWSADDSLHVGKYSSLTLSTRSNYARWAGEILRASGQSVSGAGRPATADYVIGNLVCPTAVPIDATA